MRAVFAAACLLLAGVSGSPAPPASPGPSPTPLPTGRGHAGLERSLPLEVQ